MRNSAKAESPLDRTRSDWLSRCWLACGLAVTAALFLHAAQGSTSQPAPQRSTLSNEPSAALPTKSIESLVEGDLVLARDESTGKLAPARVERIFERTADHLRILRIAAAHGAVQEIHTTDEHPFWVAGRGWVKAGQLTVEDRVLHADGQSGCVIATEHQPHPEGIRVFNLEVAGYHTYFVAASGRAPPVWVHNKGPEVVCRRGMFPKECFKGTKVKGPDWAPENPVNNPNYPYEYGLPPENSDPIPDWVIGGRLRPGGKFEIEPASPIPPNMGGKPQITVPRPEKDVILDWFHMPDKTPYR